MLGMGEEVVCCCMASWQDGVSLVEVEDAFEVGEVAGEELALEPGVEACSW